MAIQWLFLLNYSAYYLPQQGFGEAKVVNPVAYNSKPEQIGAFRKGNLILVLERV